MTEPKVLNPALALAQAWLTQLFNRYHETNELLARCNMVGAALQIREEDPTAKYVVFQDSDQGLYAYLCGGALEVDGEWNEEVDFDLGTWELRYDQVEYWRPYLNRVPSDRIFGDYYLDIDKVLAEIPTPWQQPTVGA